MDHQPEAFSSRRKRSVTIDYLFYSISRVLYHSNCYYCIMMRFIVGWIAVSLLVTLAAGESAASTLKFKNESNDWLSVHWIDPRNGNPTLIKNSISPKAKFNLNSYVGHHFEVWQELDPETGMCGSADGTCDKIGYVTVMKSPEEGERRLVYSKLK